MPLDIKTVTVLGANGTMGKCVAGVFASFGNCKVHAVCRSMADAERVPYLAATSVRAGSVARNVVPSDYTDLKACIEESDLIFDSTSESMKVKIDVLSRSLPYLKDSAIVCTGTSGLSITELSDILGEPVTGRFFGVHMFNPPYAMRLCELIAPQGNQGSSLEDALEAYLRETLLRVVVRCSDAPAFLANRIGFELINGAMRLAEQKSNRGGIDYVDAIMGPFTGRAMAPLVTADFVGLDTHAAIVDNVLTNAKEDPAASEFVLPGFCRRLIAQGRLGRKVPEVGGFYRRVPMEDGRPRTLVYDIASDAYRAPLKHHIAFGDTMKESLRTGDYAAAARALALDGSDEAGICKHLLANYMVYSVYVGRKVGSGVCSADGAMAYGFNWCPPSGMAQFIALAVDLGDFLSENADKTLLSTVPGAKAELLKMTSHDWRRYIRAR